MRILALPLLAALWAIPAAAVTPISLDQAMAHPDWIGTPVETAWWSWDGKQVFYKQKRIGSQLRDIYQAAPGKPRLVGRIVHLQWILLQRGLAMLSCFLVGHSHGQRPRGVRQF